LPGQLLHIGSQIQDLSDLKLVTNQSCWHRLLKVPL
jgi:hypothetical protein